jgi:copper(I)-binding protein
VLSLAACQQGAPDQTGATDAATAAPDAKPGMALSNGRLVLPVVAGNPAAAYFDLANGGTEVASLAAVSVEGATKAEMHQTVGGKMSPIDSATIEPGATLRFEPGANHVMAFELDPKLAPGGTTEITLTFANGDKLSAPLKVEARSDAMGGMDMGDHH